MARPKGKRVGVPTQEMVDRAMQQMRARKAGEAAAEQSAAELYRWIEEDGASRPGRNEFVTFSSDDRGMQVGFKVNVSPGIGTIMEQIVQQGLIPAYRSKQDIVRDALVHRLWDVCEGVALDGAAMETLHAETIERMLQNAKDRKEHAERVIKQSREHLRELAGTPQFWTLLEKVRVQALGLSEPWRGELLGIVAGYEHKGDGA